MLHLCSFENLILALSNLVLEKRCGAVISRDASIPVPVHLAVLSARINCARQKLDEIRHECSSDAALQQIVAEKLVAELSRVNHQLELRESPLEQQRLILERQISLLVEKRIAFDKEFGRLGNFLESFNAPIQKPATTIHGKDLMFSLSSYFALRLDASGLSPCGTDGQVELVRVLKVWIQCAQVLNKQLNAIS